MDKSAQTMQNMPVPFEEPAIFKFDEELAIDELRRKKAPLFIVSHRHVQHDGLPLKSGSQGNVGAARGQSQHYGR
jgi:hypothetical protein